MQPISRLRRTPYALISLTSPLVTFVTSLVRLIYVNNSFTEDADPNGLVSVLRAEGGWNVLLRVPSVIDDVRYCEVTGNVDHGAHALGKDWRVSGRLLVVQSSLLSRM